MAVEPHPIIESAREHNAIVPIAVFHLLAKGQYNYLAEYMARTNNTVRGALACFMVELRNDAMAKAALHADVPKHFAQIDEKSAIYLWTHQHDDLMWLFDQDVQWQRAIAKTLPWKLVLSERFQRPEWSEDLAKVLSMWEPTRLAKYPHALKYMKNPSERHVLEAACAGQGYATPEQLEAMRVGASTWFKTRKELGLNETPAEAKRAFRQWWNNGNIQPMDNLDQDIFAP